MTRLYQTHHRIGVDNGKITQQNTDGSVIEFHRKKESVELSTKVSSVVNKSNAFLTVVAGTDFEVKETGYLVVAIFSTDPEERESAKDVFRDFRDLWLCKTKEGAEGLVEYILSTAGNVFNDELVYEEGDIKLSLGKTPWGEIGSFLIDVKILEVIMG